MPGGSPYQAAPVQRTNPPRSESPIPTPRTAKQVVDRIRLFANTVGSDSQSGNSQNSRSESRPDPLSQPTPSNMNRTLRLETFDIADYDGVDSQILETLNCTLESPPPVTPVSNHVPSSSSQTAATPITPSYVNAESLSVEVLPPRDIAFWKSLEAIVASGLNDSIIRLFEHARCVGDIQQIEKHTILIPTKEAFQNLGEEAIAALETEEGRVHLASILRHNMFAHSIVIDDTDHTIVVDGRKVGSTCDIVSLNDHSLPFRVLVDHELNFTISDERSKATVHLDAYFVGTNIIHITDQVLLPISAAKFLGIELDVRSESHGTAERAPALVATESSNAECVVCSETTDKFLSCLHPVCVHCLSQLDRAKCPVCRNPIDGNQHPALSAVASTSDPARDGMREIFEMPIIGPHSESLAAIYEATQTIPHVRTLAGVTCHTLAGVTCDDEFTELQQTVALDEIPPTYVGDVLDTLSIMRGPSSSSSEPTRSQSAPIPSAKSSAVRR